MSRGSHYQCGGPGHRERDSLGMVVQEWPTVVSHALGLLIQRSCLGGSEGLVPWCIVGLRGVATVLSDLTTDGVAGACARLGDMHSSLGLVSQCTHA